MTIKYFIINDDSIIAVVHEDEKYGRTMVLNNCKINFNHDIIVHDAEANEKIKDIDLIDFLQSLLPLET